MKYIALHHTAVDTDQPQLKSVDNYHKEKWNMESLLGYYVGYNYFCEMDGTRIETRVIGEETIANKGHNCDIEERCDTISYCMAGDFNKKEPTNLQIKDFFKFVAEMKERYPNIKVVGHRDLQKNRTCPGSHVTDGMMTIFNLTKTITEEIDDIKNRIHKDVDLLATLSK